MSISYRIWGLAAERGISELLQETTDMAACDPWWDECDDADGWTVGSCPQGAGACADEYRTLKQLVGPSIAAMPPGASFVRTGTPPVIPPDTPGEHACYSECFGTARPWGARVRGGASGQLWPGPGAAPSFGASHM